MKKKEDEGIRGFAVSLQQIDDGAFHGELSETQYDLLNILAQHAETYSTMAKGSMTIVLSFAVERNGTVSIDAEVKTKTPKTKRARTQMFLTAGNNLTVEHPRQQSLPIREVPIPTAASDVAEEPRQVRNV